jgi:ATP-dependent 26S proteasome regulatory subunit
MIYFAMPDTDHRLKLWQQAFSEKTVLEPKLDLHEIAGKYELAGGAIINVTRYCSMMAIKRNTNLILKKDIIEGIRKEFGKEGKIV